MRVKEIKDKKAIKALKQLSKTPREAKKIIIPFRVRTDNPVYKSMQKVKEKYGYSFQAQLRVAINQYLDNFIDLEG